MLKTLHLKYFKSYEDFTFVFHRGVNAIIGEGMSGKTNVFRAIRRLKDYRPINSRFLSHFANEKALSTISLKTQEGNIVELKQGKNKSPVYTIISKNGNRKEFRRINKNSPIEVKRVINLDEINYQGQLDNPYIVSSSAGQVTKIINNITQINTVDNWLKAIKQNIRSLKFHLSELIIQKKKTIKELDGLNEVRALGLIIKKVKSIKIKIERFEERVYQIAKIIGEIKAAQEEKELLQKSLVIEDIIKDVEKIRKKIDQKEAMIESIIELIDAMIDKERLLEKFTRKKKIYIKGIKSLNQCPFCLSKIDDLTIIRIKREIKFNENYRNKRPPRHK
jgi:predicted ATP-dependent endonuclease of OLD family